MLASKASEVAGGCNSLSGSAMNECDFCDMLTKGGVTFLGAQKGVVCPNGGSCFVWHKHRICAERGVCGKNKP